MPNHSFDNYQKECFVYFESLLYMLQNKYLPQFDFSSAHSIIVNAPISKIFPLIREFKIKNPPVSYWLMKLRGMSAPTHFSIQHLENSRFVLLEEVLNKEIILGIIGQPWKLEGNLQIFQPHEFISFKNSDFIKATWSFELVKHTNTQTEVKTETRILCLSELVRRRFSRYWFFIKPFSGLIRKQLLKGIKREMERGS
jgi:hypothetical protein